MTATARTHPRRMRRSREPRESMVVSKAAPAESVPESSTAAALVQILEGLGVRHSFGVLGGAIAPFCRELDDSSITFVHCRHEAGAAFAAIEASLATGAPTVVVATAGPGTANALVGMAAARREGAKVVFVSGVTSSKERGRNAFQETNVHADGLSDLFTAGGLFHHALILEDSRQLDTLGICLAHGLTNAEGFVAHVGIALDVQTAVAPSPRACSPALIAREDAGLARRCAALLDSSFVIWVGSGAKRASKRVLELAERTQAPVMSSPRAKGVFPEDHPLYLGVTGLGGHQRVLDYLRSHRPDHVLVLGSRLGEFTSFWSEGYLPKRRLIHVDIGNEAFGRAYPRAETFAIRAEIDAFLGELIAHVPARRPSFPSPPTRRVEPLVARVGSGVRPSFLMSILQRQVLERSEAIVLTEAGNSFLLGSHFLRFQEPGRYRVSTSYGSMGHAAGGVIGAALVSGKAVAVVGDGALLMQNEINTAAKYGIGAVWIVLNDARYGIIDDGMRALGWQPFATEFPRVDFARVAVAMGAEGIRVEAEPDLESAVKLAMNSRGPVLVDVTIDTTEALPPNLRNFSLLEQGVNG